MPKIHESEYRFCLVLWEHEPVTAVELAKLCQEQLGWKRTTTYTVIKRLGERGILQNESGTVTSLVSKEDAQASEIDKLVDKKFEGSLPAFVAAFTKRQKLSSQELDAIQRMIDQMRGGNVMVCVPWLVDILQSMLDVSRVINVSIAASWLVLVVMLLRVLLRKAPKQFFVILWGIVAIRLLMPISIESGLSLLPSTKPISDTLLQAEGVLHQNRAYLELVTNPIYPETITVNLEQSIGSFQWDVMLWTWPWLLGMGVMLLYALVSGVRLHRRIATAVRLQDNLFQSEQVQSPFVLGIFRPRIYLPFQMDLQNLEHVVAHEQAHIRRKDHWWKPLGYLLLTIHWFNPMVWLAYILLCRDMELACDEAVIRELDPRQRADYSQALLNCSLRCRPVTAYPLAFGEIGVKTRIKAVMQYRKPGFWMVVTAVLACLVAVLCFLTDPVGMSAEMDLPYLNYKHAISLVSDQDTVTAIYCPSAESSIKIGVTEGAALAKQLDRWNWRLCKAPYERLPSPGSVEFVVADDYRITVHDRKEGQLRRYAVVQYGEAAQYYAIDRSDYPDAVALVMAPPQARVPEGGYYLTIGAENVMEIQIETPGRSGGVQNADGTAFRRGDQVWLEQLDGRSDLRGVMLTALDTHGEVCWSMSVPDGTENDGVQHVIAIDWKLEYIE